MDNIRATVTGVLNNSVFLFIVVLLLILVGIAVYINNIVPFLREKRYILSEINRTSGNERRRWKRRLRMLYVRNIPFIGWILVRFMK